MYIAQKLNSTTCIDFPKKTLHDHKDSKSAVGI